MDYTIKAFVFGAGYGTRLQPLTHIRPKVCVPVAGQPAIFYAIDRIVDAGINHCVINLHHLPDIVKNTIGDGSRWGIDVSYSFEKQILETGGALKYAEHKLSADYILIYNGDIVTDVDICGVIENHRQSGAAATLVCASWCEPKQITIGCNNNSIIDIRNSLTAGRVPSHTFLGIHVINRDVIDCIPPHQKISIIPVYLDLIKQGFKINCFDYAEGHWYDIGTIQSYTQANQSLLESRKVDLVTGQTSRLSESVKCTGYVVIGDGVVVEDDVELNNTIIWDNVLIKKGVRLSECIVTDNVVVATSHTECLLLE
ncbi:MAG: NDP-sugar synthase [Candidatus Auribacterota bacterium]